MTKCPNLDMSTGDNSTGALTTRLEQDANAMSKATGIALGHKVQIAMTLLIGVLIGLVVAWQVGLVAMAVLPFMGESTSQNMYIYIYILHCIIYDLLQACVERDRKIPISYY
jgi:ABC-type multidrug transport system fused ATPase/permease subunit